MSVTVDLLHEKQTGIIVQYDMENIPLKLIEMGCLPGNEITLLGVAPLGDPLYLNINDTHLAIRRSLAKEILVDII